MKDADIYDLFEQLRNVAIDRLTPTIMDVCGEDGLSLVESLQYIFSAEGVASVDLAFNFPHRRLGEEYNASYTKLKETFSVLTPVQLAFARFIISTTLTKVSAILEEVEELA